MAATFLQQSLAVPLLGLAGSTVSLTTLLGAAFGTNAQGITGAWLAYYDAPTMQQWNFNYWNPQSASVTEWLVDGVPITGSTAASFNQTYLPASSFGSASILVGNVIMPQLYMTVRIDDGTTADEVYVEYSISTVSMNLSAQPPVNRAPTASEIVAAATELAVKFPSLPNNNDCGWISMVIGASVGATMTHQSQSIDPLQNIESGFWRIVHRGTTSPVANWQTLTRPGDIVRFDWADPAQPQHTTLIVGNPRADGTIEVVDNGDYRGATSYVGRHFARYDSASAPASVTIYRVTTDNLYLTRTTSASETVLGTTFNDQMFAGAGNDTLQGGVGNDVMYGEAGVDVLNGGEGNDTLNGGSEDDYLAGGVGADNMSGGTGNDTYIIDDLGDHAYENAAEGTDLVNTSVSYVMEANIENTNLTGINTNDGVLGNALANIINGNAGNNGIASGNGNDTINAGAGNDVLDGGLGADAMSGGTGSDVYFVDNTGDQVVGETAQAGVYDTVWTTVNFTLPSEVEILILNGGILAINGTGNAGAGGANPNLMLGNNAANVLTTFGGDDIILGLNGNDTINAGSSSINGYNLIAGGNGADSMTGGSGHDFFAYTNISEGGDTITGFTTAGGNGLDILDLRTMFTTFVGWGGGSSTTAETSGYLTFTESGTNTLVYADANGGTHNAGEQVLLATITGTTASAVRNATLV
jgi:Ca2+-binding RTX toxin-like protein